MAKIQVRATTTIDGQAYEKTKEFEFPMFDKDLRGLLAFCHGAEEIFKIVYHSQKIVFQNSLRLELEAEHAGKEVGKKSKRDPNMAMLLGK